MMRRLLGILAAAMLLVGPVRADDLVQGKQAETKAAAASHAVEKPFLWVIKGETPNYLFGTIHIPDPRVVNLPPVVKNAVDSCDALYTEITLDGGTQMAMQSKTMLPAGQTLKSVLGDALHARLMARVDKGIAKNPKGAMVANVLKMQMETQKPWAAMAGLMLQDYTDELSQGILPLDMSLYANALGAGKEAGGIEKVEEQLAIFEGMTMEEQVKMMSDTLDELDKAEKEKREIIAPLLDAYLRGEMDAVAKEMARYQAQDEKLYKRFLKMALTDRNVVMADRIDEKIKASAGKINFFAVGAAHMGDFDEAIGVVTLLQKKGYTLVRLTHADAEKVAAAGKKK